ncbi:MULTISPECIES: hypothetical protein [Thalassospira]|uniref:Uncharacterized protein n=1 Tax=Thalassospira aquimaris TaxID=3037796 RepID=A0ABT6GDA5_9PROT|nr:MULTISPECIES: hypothetical protein [Thalassospira]MDG4719985.1 hypothetical protein [Thalassospira sp. FZY0004]
MVEKPPWHSRSKKVSPRQLVDKGTPFDPRQSMHNQHMGSRARTGNKGQTPVIGKEKPRQIALTGF